MEIMSFRFSRSIYIHKTRAWNPYKLSQTSREFNRDSIIWQTFHDLQPIQTLAYYISPTYFQWSYTEGVVLQFRISPSTFRCLPSTQFGYPLIWLRDTN